MGYLEEEAVYSYTEYLAGVDNGTYANVPAPRIAIDYWSLRPTPGCARSSSRSAQMRPITAMSITNSPTSWRDQCLSHKHPDFLGEIAVLVHASARPILASASRTQSKLRNAGVSRSEP